MQLRAFAVVSLATLAFSALGCSEDATTAATAAGEEDLTVSTPRYTFTPVADLGARIAVGEAAGGAIVVVEQIDAFGASTTTTSKWDGTKLVPVASATQPLGALGRFAYDKKTGVTWYHEIRPMKNGGRAESLRRFDGATWEAMYSNSTTFAPTYPQVATPTDAQPFVDAADGKLYRVTPESVDAFSFQDPNYGRSLWTRHDGNGSVGANAYDTARGRLVSLHPGWVTEFGPSKTPWSEWAEAQHFTTSADPSAVSCDQAFYNSRSHRSVALCHSRFTSVPGALAVEWDGTKLATAEVSVPSVPRFYGFNSVAYDHSHSTVFATADGVLYKAARTTASKKVPALATKTAQVYATEELELTLNISDALDKTTLRITDLPANAEYEDSSRTLRWTPSVTDEGKHVFHVEVGAGGATTIDTLTVDVTVLRYPSLPADVNMKKDFFVQGFSSRTTSGTEGHVTCSISGTNPGVVRSFCAVAGAGCSAPEENCGYRVTSSAVVLESLTLASTGNGTRQCGIDWRDRCPEWTSSFSLALDAEQKACVSFAYDRHPFAEKALSVSGKGCEQ